jgi:hypothetical protein
VPEFLVELYVARANGGVAERCTARAHAAAEALTRAGTPVQCLTSIFVPEDETCFLLYEAESADAVEAAVRHALSKIEGFRISRASVAS